MGVGGRIQAGEGMKSLSPTPNSSDDFQKEPDGVNDQVNVKVVHLRGSIGFDEGSINQSMEMIPPLGFPMVFKTSAVKGTAPSDLRLSCSAYRCSESAAIVASLNECRIRLISKMRQIAAIFTKLNKHN